jgi:hypothetical protein
LYTACVLGLGPFVLFNEIIKKKKVILFSSNCNLISYFEVIAQI